MLCGISFTERRRRRRISIPRANDASSFSSNFPPSENVITYDVGARKATKRSFSFLRQTREEGWAKNAINFLKRLAFTESRVIHRTKVPLFNINGSLYCHAFHIFFSRNDGSYLRNGIKEKPRPHLQPIVMNSRFQEDLLPTAIFRKNRLKHFLIYSVFKFFFFVIWETSKVTWIASNITWATLK